MVIVIIVFKSSRIDDLYYRAQVALELIKPVHAI